MTQGRTKKRTAFASPPRSKHAAAAERAASRTCIMGVEFEHVARRRRTSPRDRGSHGDWLGRDSAARTRPWELKEQLLGRATPDATGFFEALLTRLSEEQATLGRMEKELNEQVHRVAELKDQIDAVVDVLAARNIEHPTRPPAMQSGEDPADRPIVPLRPSQEALDRNYSLRRCEGFLVASPTGNVGVVEGVRFGSQLDRPDLLEVSIGHLQPELLLVPVEEVEHISFEEQRVVLVRDPRPHRNLVHQLLPRLRARLGAFHS